MSRRAAALIKRIKRSEMGEQTASALGLLACYWLFFQINLPENMFTKRIDFVALYLFAYRFENR